MLLLLQRLLLLPLLLLATAPSYDEAEGKGAKGQLVVDRDESVETRASRSLGWRRAGKKERLRSKLRRRSSDAAATQRNDAQASLHRI